MTAERHFRTLIVAVTALSDVASSVSSMRLLVPRLVPIPLGKSMGHTGNEPLLPKPLECLSPNVDSFERSSKASAVPGRRVYGIRTAVHDRTT